MSAGRDVVWAPTDRQALALRCPATQLFYGGARGGGKTHFIVGKLSQHAMMYGEHASGLVLRKTFSELEEVFGVAKDVFTRLGGKAISGNRPKVVLRPHSGQKDIVFRFRHLAREKDADHYQGHGYTVVAVDEVGNYSSMSILSRLMACLRSPGPGVVEQMVLTGNPGGPGHNWLKRTFVDPAAPMSIHHVDMHDEMPDVITEPGKSIISRCFIPSLLEDNPHLAGDQQKADAYRARIAASGPEYLVKAWLSGDWDIVAGGMFDDVWSRPRHVVKVDKVPDGWQVHRSFDWGSSAPFSVGYWAVSDGSPIVLSGKRMHLPRKSAVRISEIYGSSGKGEGLRLQSSQIAEMMLEHEHGLRKLGVKRVLPGPADASIWDKDRGLSEYEKMKGVAFVKADKSGGSRARGWLDMRMLLQSALQDKPEKPCIFISDRCRTFIELVPVTSRSEKDPDDIAPGTEDHVHDESRYFCSWLLKSSVSTTKRRIVGV